MIAEGRSDEFRRHWLGTHFFNPPRYLQLLEVIPTADTDPAVVARVSEFADRRLGKGVVVAKDTPNFIANRIGLYGVISVLRTLEDRRVDDRGDRRHHRPGARTSQERHVPHDGHRRPRRARPRRAQSLDAAAGRTKRRRSRCRRSSRR